MGPLFTILAIALYGALHSLLASHTAKRWARRAFGSASERFYRLFFNLVGGVTFLPVLAVVAAWPGRTLDLSLRAQRCNLPLSPTWLLHPPVQRNKRE